MRAVRIKQFLEEKETVNWLVDSLLPDVGWTLFVGRKGEGKTTFAMQMCLALENGLPFLGRTTRKTPILYVQADSKEVEWREILRRIAPKDSNAITAIDVPQRALGIPNIVDRLTAYVEKIKPGYIVFDSFYKLTAWPINNETGISTAVNIMDEITQNIPWLLIHHPPHNESRAAGHNSLGASCSNEWILLKTKLNIEKARLVALKEISLRRGKDGLWELYGKPQSGSNNGSSYMDREL